MMRSMIDVLIDRGERQPLECAFAELSRRGEVVQSLTYEQLVLRSSAIAAHLQSLRLAGESVLLLLPHGLDFICAFFGCLLAKSIAVPQRMPKGAEIERLASVAKVANVASILTVTSQLQRVGQMLAPFGFDKPIIDVSGILNGASEDWRRPQFEEGQPAVIQFTSGTTRLPKGVCISHGGLISNSESIRRAFGFKGGETGVSWLPFTHDMGLIGHVVQPVYSGLRSVFMSPTAFIGSPISWLKAITQFGGYCSGAPNFAYRLCCDKISHEELKGIDLSSWKLAYCGSERIEPATIMEFIRKFSTVGFAADSFFPCYGLAEATLFVTGRRGVKVLRRDSNNVGYVSVGRPAPGVDVRVIDVDTQVENTENGVGELWIKSPSNALGYCDNGNIGSAGFQYKFAGSAEYVKSGDLGFCADGDFYIVGRVKDVIKIRGIAYAAEDIETIIADVAKAKGFVFYASAGISVVDGDAEKIIAFIESDLTDLDEERQSEFRRAVLSGVSDGLGVLLDRILILERGRLPRTASGKVRRNACIPIYDSERTSEQCATVA